MLRVEKVTTGCFWVESTDAKRRILCGCPPDCVKFLLQKGMLLPREVEGVRCESGPDAILLADLSLRQAKFWNLAEFPILQMLYRQGMLIPGHPNNDGRKPKLIGLREQVEAQKRYMTRGNYGLADLDELLASGVSPEEAALMMAIKRRFAFDEMLAADDLVESIHLDNGPIAIAPGFIIEHIALNRYRFQEGDHLVEVDLNPESGEQLVPPFFVNPVETQEGYFSVIHSGEGDGWDPNRPSMGSILYCAPHYYLVDAGPYVKEIVGALGISLSEIRALFLTHVHDDHFAGISGLLQSHNRIPIYASPYVLASFVKKSAALLNCEEGLIEEYFDLRPLQPEQWNLVDCLEVRPFYSPHPIETNCFQFRVLTPEGYKTYGHLADLSSFNLLEQMLSDGVIDQVVYERIRSNYLMACDLKKIDIGGGMIHGQAQDFISDKSSKIVLAHKAEDLSNDEKMIGSSATFGSVDVLVGRPHDAYTLPIGQFFQAIFAELDLDRVEMFRQCPIERFSPGQLLRTVGDELLLVLRGSVEQKLRQGQGQAMATDYVAGALVGGFEFFGLQSEVVYRTKSYVQAVRIRTELFRYFLESTKQATVAKELFERLLFLVGCQSFLSSEISPRSYQLARCMLERSFEPKRKINKLTECGIFLIQSGRASLSKPRLEFSETCGPGSALFADSVIDHSTTLRFHVRPQSELHGYWLSRDTVFHAPFLYWSIFEQYQRLCREAYFSARKGLHRSSA